MTATNIKLTNLEADPNTLLTSIDPGDFLLVHDISETIDVRKIKVISEANLLKLVTETARQAVVASQAAGDLFYATSATALARLPKATNGNILSLSAGIPAWSGADWARLTLIGGTPQSIPNNSPTPITSYNSTDADTSGFHTGSNSYLVIPTGLGGIYVISCFGQFSGNADTKLRQIGIYINDTIPVDYSSHNGTTDGDSTWVGCSAITSINDGEKISLVVNQKSGVSLNLYTTYFSIAKIK